MKFKQDAAKLAARDELGRDIVLAGRQRSLERRAKKLYRQHRERGWGRHGIHFNYWQFLDMLKEQHYQCALCERVIEEATAYVAHDHATHVEDPALREQLSRCKGGKRGPVSLIARMLTCWVIGTVFEGIPCSTVPITPTEKRRLSR